MEKLNRKYAVAAGLMTSAAAAYLFATPIANACFDEKYWGNYCVCDPKDFGDYEDCVPVDIGNFTSYCRHMNECMDGGFCPVVQMCELPPGCDPSMMSCC
jgi:hypothetical protein